ncbi:MULTISPECIES: leucine-rich repeat domain-containing protein [unclassified Kribbella]|uniref:leucine-rich repeat domain-containing protein n=1 Tax=unclassified Kribbella TaxID=2644121 RepID=UPI003017F2CE
MSEQPPGYSGRRDDQARAEAAIADQSWMRTGHLSLRRLGLPALPDRLSHDYSFLTSLDLSGNRLTDLPRWLFAAPRLQRLILAGNRLAELPDEVGLLTALRVLDVSDNRLRSIPSTIRSCHELRRVDVSGNNLRDISPLAEVPGLLVLDAANNRLTELATPPGPPTLTSLDLSGNDLDALPAGFDQLRALRRLDLSGNYLTSEAVAVLRELPLEELYLDDNRLSTLRGLPDVVRLSALGNPILPPDYSWEELAETSFPGGVVNEPEPSWHVPVDEGPVDEGPADEEPVVGDPAEIIRRSVAGGFDPGRRYFDTPASSFEVSLSIARPDDTQRVVDLYYKRFNGVPATVDFHDGARLTLGSVSRRTALEHVQEHQPSGAFAEVNLSPTNSRVEWSAAFLEQSVARLSSGELIRPGLGRRRFVQTELSPPARVLNVALTNARQQVLAATTSLRTEDRYGVRIDVGPLVEDSVVINPVPVRVDELQPDDADGYQFDVVVSSCDVEVESRLHRLFLPLNGASPYLYVPFETTEQLGAASLRVTLYHRNNVIQSVRVDFDVHTSERGTSQIKGIVDFALTDDAARAPELPGRALSILTNDGASGTHTIVVNNSKQAIAVTVSDGQATTVLTAVRKRLTEITLGASGNKSQYDEDNRKRTADFINDLRRMALSGAQLWQAVVPDVRDRSDLREQLAYRAKIQISRATRTVFPWALIYDIPRDPEEDGTLCQILEDWEVQQASLRDYPSRCPHEASHGLNVICPYGFWGFRHLIEQPPSVRSGTLRTSIKVAAPARAAAARSLALNQTLTTTHFSDLEQCLADWFELVPCDDRSTLEATLADPRLPLAYFYCHGRTEMQADVVMPYLEIGTDTRIAPGSLGAWHEAGGWGSSHWSETAPLVFINGCETAALQPSDVVSFVDAFAGLHAAGVVGTEISVSQRVAGEMALNFYRHFAGPDGVSVGTALYRARIDLLRKGNIAGLVYTPFCSMDLILERS